MPVINGVYTKDFPALGRAPIDADIIPIAEVANQITYKTTIGEIFNAKVFGTTGRLSKFTGANTLGNSILNEIGNAIHLTNSGSSFASFGIINPGTPGDPGVDNDCFIGSTINNDFTIRVNNTEAARFDTALRFKIANIPNADTDTDKFLVSDNGTVKYRTGAELLSDIGGASASGYVTLDTTQTITGTKTFDNPIYLKQRASFIEPPTGYSLISSTDLGFWFANKRAGGAFQSFNLDVTTITNGSVRTYIMPNANGTLALTSDIPSLTGYVTLDTAQTITGAKTLTSLLTGTRANFTSSGSDDTFAINHSSGSGIGLSITKGGNGEGLYVNKTSGSGNAATIIGTLNATTLVKNGGTSSQFLKADGSVDSSVYALDSAVVKLAGTQTITGSKTFTSDTIFSNNIYLTQSSTPGTIPTGYSEIYAESGAFSFVEGLGANFKQFSFLTSALSTNSGRSYTMPNSNGTIALTSDLGAYLPLSGGTLTGALGGTSATFSGAVQSTSFNGVDNISLVAQNINTNGTVLALNSAGTVGTIKLQTNSTDRLILTSSGNLGLGVTPSAWASGFTALQVKNASLWSTGNDASLTANAYYDGSNYRYIGSAAATRVYHNTDGSINWAQAPSGTAGNAISFTQAMTLDASGRLGIGTTSPSYLLDLWSTSATVRIRNITAPATGGTSSLLFEGINNFSGVSQSFINSLQAGNSGATQLVFGTSGTTDATATERMRITSGGNVGIGTTSPAVKFNVNSGGTSGNSFSAAFSDNTTNQNSIAFSHFDNNSRIYATFLAGAGSDQSLSFWTTLSNSAQFERMRITSGGDVLIGTTGGSHKLTVNVGSGADREMFICGVTGVSNGFRIRYDNATSTVRVSMTSLPTSSTGLSTGDIWNDSGTLKIVL
jgi:hypothetical protein